jgi:YbbR domain-containing protein
MGTRNPLVSNALWFVASFVLAFFVWLIATTQSDPIETRRLNTVPIQFQNDPTLLIVGGNTRSTVAVLLTGQRSVVSIVAQEDVTVRADLRDLGPGTHTVELEVNVARRRVNADTQPRQITLSLELLREKLVQVQADVQPPPLGYEMEPPQFSAPEVLVRGAASRVEQVVAARVSLNLTDRRTTLEQDASLTPIDAQGNIVADVTLEPQTIRITIPIRQREDVSLISISPDVDANTLTSGYVLSDIRYEPQSVLVSGSPLPGTLFTERISLTNRTGDFEVTVPLIVPDGLQVLSSGSVTVEFDVSPLTGTRQFEDVPVTVVGLPETLSAEIVPEQVSAIITGPQPVLESLGSEDIQVVLDLADLTPGSYDLAPAIFTGEAQIVSSNISILPNVINVTIINPADETEATESP